MASVVASAGRIGAWEITQAGRTFLGESGQADHTPDGPNNDPYFLGKVTRVVLFGRMLKPDVERLSDVDLAA